MGYACSGHPVLEEVAIGMPEENSLTWQSCFPHLMQSIGRMFGGKKVG